jgi:enolase
VDFTNEFVVELGDGSVGIGGAPQGETISIYEDKACAIEPASIVERIKNDGLPGTELGQEAFDGYLEGNITTFGRNNAYALSLAFFNAMRDARSVLQLFGEPERPLEPPAICLNILNGGWHAYTNPVLSDFPEYILVAKSNDIGEVIAEHNKVQEAVRERLVSLDKIVIGNNPVNRFETRDNRECLDFLLGVCEDLDIRDKFDVMIDASAGDLWDGNGYQLSLTDKRSRSEDEFCDYWMDMIHDYDIGFLEDPFREEDFEHWRGVTTSGERCRIIGDNFYSSDAERIAEGAQAQYTHGAIIKPNQAGTVSATVRALRAARDNSQIVVSSHRSISTESTFLSALSCVFGVEYIKIGPLCTDYSSIVRLNEIIRLSEA